MVFGNLSFANVFIIIYSQEKNINCLNLEPQEPVFGKRLSEPPGIPPAPVPAPAPGQDYYSQTMEPIFGKKMNTNSGSYGEGSGSSSSIQGAGEYGQQAGEYGQQQAATEYGSLPPAESGDQGGVMFGRQFPTSEGNFKNKSSFIGI